MCQMAYLCKNVDNNCTLKKIIINTNKEAQLCETEENDSLLGGQ